MAPDPVAMRDKAQLRDTFYRDPAMLGAREEVHRRFQVNALPMAEWELGLVELSRVRQALDAGCGIGDFLLPLARRLAAQGASVVALDLAEGSLGQAQARLRAEGLHADCILGDVEALPFADGTFDLVLANYLLYHVPHLDRAIAELRRVLRPGGTLLAATNGQDHMHELWHVVEQALLRAGVSPQRATAILAHGQAAGALSFRLDNGAQCLRRSFADVHLERYPDELHVTEVEPLVAYLRSLWFVEQMLAGATASSATSDVDDTHGVLVTPPLDQSHVAESLRIIIQERLRAEGVVRISKETGAFVAR